MEAYDVIVIGAGPAGGQAALRAAHLGLSVACIERDTRLGRSSLTTDCLPAQALLHASALYETARTGANARFGIASRARLNLARMRTYVEQTVAVAAAERSALFAEPQVAWRDGTARIAGPGKVVVRDRNGTETTLSARHIVVATGSQPIPLPGSPFDRERIVSAADALALTAVPGRLAIIGGGQTGIELAAIWRRLGAKVVVVEKHRSICRGWDAELTGALQTMLMRQGLVLRLSTEAVAVRREGEGVVVACRSATGQALEPVEADIALVAIGRQPALFGLDLEAAALQRPYGTRLDGQDDERALPAIWLIGDAGGGPMQVPKAMEEGIACAELIAGQPGYVEYQAIPATLRITPEAAMVGSTEEALRAAGVAYTVGRAAFSANHRARLEGSGEGFVKLLADARTGVVLGAHMIGPGVSELVPQAGMALEVSALCEDLARICHPFPSCSDALRLAAMNASGWTPV